MLDMSKDQRTISLQRERIEELEETVLQLREEIAASRKVPDMGMEFPPSWRLAKSHRKILGALYASRDGYVAKEELALVACVHKEIPDEEMRLGLLKVQVCRLRSLTAGLGIAIVTHWGTGYEITPASKSIIKEALERRTEA